MSILRQLFTVQDGIAVQEDAIIKQVKEVFYCILKLIDGEGM